MFSCKAFDTTGVLDLRDHMAVAIRATQAKGGDLLHGVLASARAQVCDLSKPDDELAKLKDLHELEMLNAAVEACTRALASSPASYAAQTELDFRRAFKMAYYQISEGMLEGLMEPSFDLHGLDQLSDDIASIDSAFTNRLLKDERFADQRDYHAVIGGSHISMKAHLVESAGVGVAAKLRVFSSTDKGSARAEAAVWCRQSASLWRSTSFVASQPHVGAGDCLVPALNAAQICSVVSIHIARQPRLDDQIMQGLEEAFGEALDSIDQSRRDAMGRLRPRSASEFPKGAPFEFARMPWPNLLKEAAQDEAAGEQAQRAERARHRA